MSHASRTLLGFAALLWLACPPPQCQAGSSLTLTTNRLSLDGVDDVAGTWLYEGGTVTCPDGKTHVANYTAHWRVTSSGADPQNTAMLTITLFFLGSTPPENITIQGAHDFGSGAYIGSVSAASTAFAKVRGNAVTGVAGFTGTVTIGKLGNVRINPCR